MMFRKAVTGLGQLSRQAGRLSAGPRVFRQGPRGLYDGPGRWLPVLSRFPRPSNVFRVMEEQLRDMQRVMDEFIPASRYAFPYAKASKDLEVKYNKKEFEVSVDVEGFKPEEVQVKLVGDVVEIHGKHTRKADEHSSFSTQFSRQFKIPEDVEAESLECTWAEEGKLVIRGYVKGSEKVTERIINITREKSPENKE